MSTYVVGRLAIIIMKKYASILCRKIYFVLNWNPIWCCFSFTSNERFWIFNSFLQKILAEHLQYIYAIIASLSAVALLLQFFESIFISEGPELYNSWYTFVLSGVNIAYHTLLFIAIKVKYVKKKVLKIITILNVVSIVLVQLLFAFNVAQLSSRTNSLTTLSVGLSINIFESTVYIVYFQNSFLLSLLVWLGTTSITCWISLSDVATHTNSFIPVVSLMLVAMGDGMQCISFV